MANENMTMDEAVDMAVALVTPQGGEPIAEDAPVEETPQDAPETTETPAEKVEVEPEEETSSDDLAAQLAELTHDNVVHTKAGKGLMSELQREREKRHSLEVEIEALKTSDTAKVEAAEEEGEIDDEADVFTALDVKKIVSREVAKALKPTTERINRTDKADRQQVMATGLAALAAEQKAGSIPAGVNVASIVNSAVAELKESDPAQLAILLSKPNPVEAIWKYSNAFIPAVQQSVAKATRTKADTHAERLAKGQPTETGGESTTISDFIADLNGP